MHVILTNLCAFCVVWGGPDHHFEGRFYPGTKEKHRFTWASKDLHSRQKKGKKEGCLCFEEAQDSYWLEAKSPQRDNSCGQRERTWIRIKVQQPKPAGREGGASGRDGGCTSSASTKHNLSERTSAGSDQMMERRRASRPNLLALTFALSPAQSEQAFFASKPTWTKGPRKSANRVALLTFATV